MTVVLTWKWGAKYGAGHVAKLQAGVARHLKREHRFLCVTDDPRGLDCQTVGIADPALLKFDDGCYARLRMFDPIWQAQVGASDILCLDLDMVIVGDIGPLLDHDDPFRILIGGHFNPCRVNGSVMHIKAGAVPQIWLEFTVEEARRVARKDGSYRGTDQTWIAHKLPNCAGWTHEDGIYGYGKPGWPGHLPADARIVAFPGSKDPATVKEAWVREHWR